MIVTFCGHAQFQQKREHEQHVISFLETHVSDPFVEFYLGGYGEFDRFAYDCCQKYKSTHPNASIILVTPYLTPEYQRNHLQYQEPRYDSILYPGIEDKPPRFAISYRNKYMVEKADYVIAYIDHAWGGAYQSYSYAKRKGKRIWNLAEKE